MGLFTSSTKSESTNEAADFVAPHLEASTAAYGTLATPEAYDEPWQAELDPMLSGAWQNMYNNPNQQAMMGQASGYGEQGMDALERLNQGFQYDQGTYDQTMGNLMPGMQGSYDAATRDNNRNLNWNELTGLDMGLAQSGQQGSTKHAQGSALAQGMNMDRNSDIGASMYQNAVNQAQNAAMTGGQQNLNAANQAANFGMQGMGMGFDMNQQMMQNQLTAGQGSQGYNQQGINMNREQWDQQQRNPWEFEGQRMGNLANVGNMFGTQTTTSESDPGIGNIAMQAAAAYMTGGASLAAGGLMSGGGGGGGGAPPVQGMAPGYSYTPSGAIDYTGNFGYGG